VVVCNKLLFSLEFLFYSPSDTPKKIENLTSFGLEFLALLAARLWLRKIKIENKIL
jgi:hypothetical protein